MSVIRRTWVYGTQFRCKVVASFPSMIMVEAAGINEAFSLVGHGVFPLPPVGSMGLITFTQGGPTGGYWKFTQ
ncbi:MAG: hypothetical protein JWR19_2194 [Pedosphaera sp.]|nr:hypothetical protein [Pedosphaera sp.]